MAYFYVIATVNGGLKLYSMVNMLHGVKNKVG